MAQNSTNPAAAPVAVPAASPVPENPEAAKFRAAEMAIAEERIAKNKARAAEAAYDPIDHSDGAYSASVKRADKLQALSTAGKGPPAPKAEDVAAAATAAAAATKKVDAALANG